jgi:hypothetical protein
MLLGNGNLLNKLPLAQIGGVASNSRHLNVSMPMVGTGLFDNKTAIPNGYGGRAIVLPMKAGGISGSSTITLTPIGSGALGMNGVGSATVVLTTSGIGSLISSGTGTATLSLTASGVGSASIYGIGVANISLSASNALSPSAIGHCEGYSSLSIQSNGTITAKGHMIGSTIDTTSLTPATIWSYDNRTLTTDVATKGDVWGSKFS